MTLISRDDSDYIAFKKYRCPSVGTFDTEFVLLFPAYDGPDYSETRDLSAAQQINKIVDLIEDDLVRGIRFEQIAFGLAEKAQRLCDELLHRLEGLKRDHIRLDYYGEGHINVYAPGLAKQYANFSSHLLTCDENFTLASLRPVARFALVLKKSAQQEEAHYRYMTRLTDIVEHFHRAQWRALEDGRWARPLTGGTHILEYLAESWLMWQTTRQSNHKRPMHTNGLAEYGMLLLALHDYYADQDPAQAQALLERVEDIRDFMRASLSMFPMHDRWYALWRYVADVDSSVRMEDPGHGMVVMEFVLELHDRGIGFQEEVTGALLKTFVDLAFDNEHYLKATFCDAVTPTDKHFHTFCEAQRFRDICRAYTPWFAQGLHAPNTCVDEFYRL